MKRIGIFGGTFNPPHFGHIHLAINMLEKMSLDQVVWIPSMSNPLKEGAPTFPFNHRYQMVLRAVERVDRFVVDPIESFREPPSYTIDTVRALIDSAGPNTEFYLILGSDHLASLDKWKEVHKLLDLVTPLVGMRQGTAQPVDNLDLSKKHKELLKKGIVDIPIVEISATDIRNRIKEGLPCSHLTPRPTLDYITENRLYY